MNSAAPAKRSTDTPIEAGTARCAGSLRATLPAARWRAARQMALVLCRSANPRACCSCALLLAQIRRPACQPLPDVVPTSFPRVSVGKREPYPTLSPGLPHGISYLGGVLLNLLPFCLSLPFLRPPSPFSKLIRLSLFWAGYPPAAPPPWLPVSHRDHRRDVAPTWWKPGFDP